MDFTGLERDVLDWIARELADPIVSRQVKAAIPIEREYTGVGSFTELRVQDERAPRTTLGISPVDPNIVSPELSHGGGCVLFFENGLLATLELFAYVGEFPRDLREWTLVR
jgi:hypothetical protein